MPRVLTLPPSVPFLPTLARALLDGGLVEGYAPRRDPLALAGATVFLPTRRAGRLFAEALLEASGGTALLLPRIVPLGDVDEDALAFSEDAPVLAAPHAIAPVHRRLVLARLVAHWRDTLSRVVEREAVAAGTAATFALADALGALFDDLTTAGLTVEALDGLVPDELDRYFKVGLDFVRIARRAFSAYLDEAGLVEPAARRDALVDAEARRLAALGPEAGPVIAAGSTGSMPATARLLAAIAHLPRGAVVLPGLDQDLDEASFARITDARDPAPDHPQYGLARLLGRLGLKRGAVVPLAPPAAFGRELLMSEALRQAETSDLWARLPERLPAPDLARAMAGLSVVEADDPRAEALAIALLLRDSLERPEETCALVTPDRDLARRVAAEMGRFGVVIDDSAGTPLADAPAGRLARLVVETAAEQLAPVCLFALLTHPLATFGLDGPDKSAAVAALELIALRGPRPRAGIAGLEAAIAAFDPGDFRGADPRRRMGPAGIAAARDLVRRLGAAFGPLLALGERRSAVPLADLVVAHRAAFEAMAAPLDPDAEDAAAAALARTFETLADAAPDGPGLDLPAYAEAAGALFADAMVRPLAEPHARIRILGPLEARLVSVDRVVLGGLVEGAWPHIAETDPWLSRPMRAQLGLDLPERRIGLSAHDFAQSFGAPQVVLTFAAKVGGTQSVPSRFLQRLKTVAGEAEWQAARARGARWVEAARRLDDAPAVPRALRPAPAPPLALRPRRLSVTEIETFLRDPYSIYARHILGLVPLDPLDAAPGGAERGSALHEAIGRFTQAHPKELPADALDLLLAEGRAAFAPLAAFPAEHALWWARFERAAAFLVTLERERRLLLDRVVAEAGGSLEIPLGGNTFRLTGRADRIEVRADGRLNIVDFKTGTAPSAKQAASLAPQLPLEAAMAARGAFPDAPEAEVADIVYIELKGTAAGGEEKAVRIKDHSTSDLAEAALSGLTGLLQAFENETQGYRSLSAPQWAGRHGDYDHLARVREWALSGEESE
ncbi:double-strand break repair protein AddB [Xanthobacter autotrophicus DSM 431]|uniref:double-strand break repair protein AddB n=1 Tax=Xanthobacter nonsaccharivorans TaxID=3119912 RepID=UPI0037275ACE